MIILNDDLKAGLYSQQIVNQSDINRTGNYWVAWAIGFQTFCRDILGLEVEKGPGNSLGFVGQSNDDGQNGYPRHSSLLDLDWNTNNGITIIGDEPFLPNVLGNFTNGFCTYWTRNDNNEYTGNEWDRDIQFLNWDNNTVGIDLTNNRFDFIIWFSQTEESENQEILQKKMGIRIKYPIITVTPKITSDRFGGYAGNNAVASFLTGVSSAPVFYPWYSDTSLIEYCDGFSAENYSRVVNNYCTSIYNYTKAEIGDTVNGVYSFINANTCKIITDSHYYNLISNTNPLNYEEILSANNIELTQNLGKSNNIYCSFSKNKKYNNLNFYDSGLNFSLSFGELINKKDFLFIKDRRDYTFSYVALDNSTVVQDNNFFANWIMFSDRNVIKYPKIPVIQSANVTDGLNNSKWAITKMPLYNNIPCKELFVISSFNKEMNININSPKEYYFNINNTLAKFLFYNIGSINNTMGIAIPV